MAVEFQIDGAAAPDVASKLQSAGIPLIAVDIPHPGATHLRADNHLAGLAGRRCLGHYATQRWQDSVDEILLLEIARPGPLVHTRVDEILDGTKEAFSAAEICRVVRLDAKGEFRASLECVRNYPYISSARHILVGAANDPSAVGGLRAFQECGRSANCAVVAQNAEPEARSEMRETGTRLIGSVAYFPERYWDAIVRIATHVLAGKNVPPAAFTTHQLVTPENVNRLCSDDALFVRLAREYA
ncbi:MAG: hypothetical protein LAN62_14850 [Acidobacteriia bacterium]|nr:hypothetical protein [Terriglobia bacterium]